MSAERNIRPEFVALGYLAENPAHGYELYRRFGETLGGLWRISESQMYATLKRLEARGLIVGTEIKDGESAVKRQLALTSDGRDLFETWLAHATACNPRALKLEFLTRLYFARLRKPDVSMSIAEAQIKAISAEIERMRSRRERKAEKGSVPAMAAAFRLTQLRAALKWLESATIH